MIEAKATRRYLAYRSCKLESELRVLPVAYRFSLDELAFFTVTIVVLVYESPASADSNVCISDQPTRQLV